MKILIVEDEKAISDVEKAYIERDGYGADIAPDGLRALELFRGNCYDLVLLDLMLPGMQGEDVCREMRKVSNVPILMVTARSREDDVVAGLDAGADDYLTKPFHMEELLARLRALIRRASGQASAVLQCGALQLDTRSGRVTCAGQPVVLTGHEYRVFDYLMHRPGMLVSRTELTEHIYAQDFDRDSNTIEVFVGRLRRKLPAACIETVRGMGYRLVPP